LGHLIGETASWLIEMNNARIVYISGVWDLFHIGHLNVIKCARARGDFLVVGIVTDEFAIEYKGEPPVIPFEQRRAIVESVRYVDATERVTSFDLPRSIYDITIRAHGPHYGHYAGQRVILKRLEDLGIETVLIPRTPGISTTHIKQRIKGET
jgi:glycerol-3-phosphate cytidylyltransferase